MSTKNRENRKSWYTFPNKAGLEGQDHINVSVHSKTRLGKVLDPNYIKVISYPELGKFSSVKSLWHWLHSDDKDDRIRKMVGIGLGIHAREHHLYGKKVSNFKAVIGYATWLKLKDYPEQLEELKNLSPNLILLSYYTHKANSLRISNSYATVILPVLEIIREALVNGEEPDFSCLCKHPKTTQCPYIPTELEGYKAESGMS